MLAAIYHQLGRDAAASAAAAAAAAGDDVPPPAQVQHPIPAHGYLAELTGIELILGAADTCLVNLPVAWISQRCFDLGVGLGTAGHINLSLSVVTYILNTWLFADKMTTFDSYRIINGGAAGRDVESSKHKNGTASHAGYGQAPHPNQPAASLRRRRR